MFFTDLNADGAMDVFAVVCDTQTATECQSPTFYYWYNKQFTACNNAFSFGNDGCRSSDALCDVDNDFALVYTPTEDGWSDSNFVYNAALAYPTGVSGIAPLPSSPTIMFIESLGSTDPVRGLSISDINLDGFPDFAAVFKDADGNSEAQMLKQNLMKKQF